MIADCKFINVNALRGKVKEIISARKNGQVLEAASADFALVKAVLGYHPKGAEKTKDMKDLKVDESAHAGTRCFWMVKEDGSVEDISIRKCLDAIEANPPYAEEKKVEEKAEEKAEEKKDEKVEEKVEEKKEETKENVEVKENAEKKEEEKPKAEAAETEKAPEVAAA